ncbi:MAG: GumC family protein [Phormidesmis sp.]
MTDSSLRQIPSNQTLPNRTGRVSKLGYLGLGLLANTLIWGLALAYLKLSPTTYKSEWGLNVLGTDAGVDVTLPEGGRASRAPAAFSVSPEDPRTDYVYLAQSPDIIKEAAAQVNMTVEDYGSPDITTDEDSSIIAFVNEGETPEMAQKQAAALYVVLDRRIEQLRNAELLRRERETKESLEEARKQVETAQNELASYQATSGLSSEAQIADLAVGVEQLRREYAQAIAQERGLSSRVQQLAQDINESSAGAADAYRLQGDPVYQNQFAEYGVVAAEYADVSSQLGAQHPQVVAKRAELEGLAAALEGRGSFLLGRQVDQSVLTQLAPIGLDPRVEASRGDLFQEAVNSRATQSGLQSQTVELSNQIVGLENRLRQLSQEQFTVDRLQRNLQVAEAIFASSVAKLNLNEGDIYSVYPPIQLAAEPTLPDEDKYISPSPPVAIGGALAGSFLVTTGLLLHWANRRNSEEEVYAAADFPFRA